MEKRWHFGSGMMKHKFKARPVKLDGEYFASKLEYSYYQHLEVLKKAGEVIFYLRQVPLHLPGGTKYVVDFQVFDANGDVRFVDVKGMETDLFLVKKREIEAIYPITIQVIKKGDF